jgi:hypothetical protein
MNGWNGSSSYGASAGNALGPPGSAVGSGAVRWPEPGWKFGLRVSDDRGDV